MRLQPMTSRPVPSGTGQFFMVWGPPPHASISRCCKNCIVSLLRHDAGYVC